MEYIVKDTHFEKLLKLLSGYPLALKAVLPNLRTKTAKKILEDLDKRLDGLDKGNAQERIKSIIKCIEYSHSNLSEDAQKLFDQTDTQQIISGEAELFVINSIITSRDFSIHVTESKAGNVDLDIPTIQTLVTNSNIAISVQKESETAITFKGDKALTFAFTCLVCEVDEAGRITLRPKALPKGVFNHGNEELAHLLLTDEAEMMVF